MEIPRYRNWIRRVVAHVSDVFTIIMGLKLVVCEYSTIV